MSRPEVDVGKLANAIRASAPKEPVRDPHVSDDPEKLGQREFAAERAEDQNANALLERLKAAEDENARLREREAKYEQLHKKWVLGDYSGMASDHPFEVVVFSDDQPWSDPVVEPCHNGHKYPIVRGIPTRVPKFIVDILDQARIEGMQQLVKPDGTVQSVHVHQHRFAFSAHPVY